MSPRRPLPLGSSLALLAVASGCAVGYLRVRPEGGAVEKTPRDWSRLTFTVSGEPRDRFVAARVLRERYGAIVMEGEQAGAFALDVSRGPVRASYAAFLPSFLTFAVLPGYLREEHVLTLTLIAPGGRRVSATDHLTERAVSWLPFLLLGPTYIVTLNGGHDGAALDRLAAAEELVARFLVSAESFVASGGSAQEPSP